MNKVTIEPNKHIAFIIQPRSGSSVLRDYLCEILHYNNAGEILNHNVETIDIEIKNNKIVKWEHADKGSRPAPDEPNDNLTQRSYDHLNTLTQLTEIKEFCIFTVLVRSFRDSGPAILQKLKERNDIQFIRQERADVLYSILSAFMSINSGEFHNTDPNIIKKRELKRGEIDINLVLRLLNLYVNELKLINISGNAK